MSAAWVLYVIGAALVAYAAAMAAEYVVRSFSLPTRFVWIAAIVATAMLSLVPLARRSPRAAASPTASPTSVSGEPAFAPSPSAAGVEVAVRGPGILERLRDRVIAASRSADPIVERATPILAASALLYLAACVALLRRARSHMKSGTLLGVPVLVSHEFGPALLGVWRPRIVVPSWLLDLPDESQRLILEHERSHADAGDNALLLGSIVFAAVQPWNPGAWMLLAGLRFAVEADCDRRVLDRCRNVRGYGELLIAVYRRITPGLRPAIAFVERPSNLERRIRRMAGVAPGRFSLANVGCAAAVAIAVMVACETPVPRAHADTVATHVSITGGGTCSQNGPSLQMLGSAVRARHPELIGSAGSQVRTVVDLMLDENCGVVRDTTFSYPSGEIEPRMLFARGFPGVATPGRPIYGFALGLPGEALPDHREIPRRIVITWRVVPSVAWVRQHSGDACGWGSRYQERCAERGTVTMRLLDSLHAVIAVRGTLVGDSARGSKDHYFLVTAARALPRDITQTIQFAHIVYQKNAVFVDDRTSTALPYLFGPSFSPDLASMPRPMKRIDQLVGIAHYDAPPLTLEDVPNLKPAAKCDGPIGSCYEVGGRTISFP